MIPKHIQKDLEYLKEANQLRELKMYGEGIDFFSNDYLGLAKSWVDNQQGLKIGSTGSRLISGNHEYFELLENFLSNWFGKSVLLYGSGYLANIGVLSSIPTRHDTILYDSLCHTSLKDGIRLSLAKSYPFPHNNYEKLEKLIQNSQGEVYVVVESVYSMDGDSPDAHILKYLVDRYGIYLIVDEAHSFGICGEDGKGWINQNDLNNHVFLGIYPLGKAAGAYGAFVMGDKMVIDYLINHSRTFIYSTALPPLLVFGIYQNLLKLQRANEPRKYLMDLCQNLGGQWIYPIIIPGNDNCKKFANFLLNNGILCKAILSPTVPKGTERIRIVLHATNTNEEVEWLKKLVNQYILERQ